MGRRRSLKLAGVASLAVISIAGPASAGQCGHSYSVDAPTTLSKVARACAVSVSALREANPGVNPGNVRPGQHLSVPPATPQGAASPIASASPPTIDVSSDTPGSSHPFIVSPGYASYDQNDNNSKTASFLGADPRGDQYRRNASETRAADKAPVWLAERAPEGGHYGETSRLSFQKQSAMRIRAAGYTRANLDVPSPDGIPAARFTKDSSIVPRLSPHNEEASYKLPDYGSIGKLPDDGNAQKISFALNGHVKAVEEGCLVLQSADNVTWRLAMPSPADQLVGKTVTAWGVKGAGASCGEGLSMLVSHAIYAEPWQSQRGADGINP